MWAGKMKTLLFLTAVIAGAAGVGAWYWTASPEEGPQFRQVRVSRDALLISVSATGTVEPVEVIDVGVQIAGRIECFGPDPAKPGETIDFCSEIEQGTILAQIDDSPYQIELDRTKADLRLAKAELARYQARLAQAERNYQRAELLRETNPESDYDRALAEHEMAKADVQVGQARLEQAELAVEEAEVNLGFTVIESPIDGVVIDRRVNVGQTVVAGLNAPSLFLLAKDLSQMQVWAAVNEADIGDIHVGQPVTFRVDAYRDRSFTGTVSQIRLNAGMSHDVVIYGVMIDVDNTDGKLLPYMTASIQFEVARRTNILRVPNQALRWRPRPEQITPEYRARFVPDDTDGESAALDEEGKVVVDSPTVWAVADDGLVRPVEIDAGLTDGMFTELLDGDLKEGDQLVAATIREAEQDFVSSFVSKVTETRD
jgi:HlyD family secretion protein